MTHSDRAVCVVTGGRGFAARHLVVQLLRSEQWIVRILDLASEITLQPSGEELLQKALAAGTAQYVAADIRNKSQVIDACKGAFVVFHMAAPDSSINDFNLHYNVTVKGTQNIIDACLCNNVKKLIYTSSPSTVFDGVHGIIDGDESLPYPDKHNDPYSETKAQAEALVLSANRISGLVTCALRPSSLFGPGDRLLVPSLVAGARTGKMKFILGDGKNMYDFTYVENVAHAHVCAEKALDIENGNDNIAASGKAYFITNMEPRRFWDFVSDILEGLGYDRPKIHLPVSMLMPLAFIVEWCYHTIPIFGASPPQFTPARLRLVTSWRTFKCDRAVKFLGYKPTVSLEEGLNRTIAAYPDLHAKPPPSKPRELEGFSKTHQMLGGGQVADLLLWRNEKRTFLCALGLPIIMYAVLWSGLTLLTIISKLLLVLTVAAYFWSYLPSSLFGMQVPKFSSSHWEVSEDAMNLAIQYYRCTWNSVWKSITEAVESRNYFSFVKIMACAYMLKILGRFSFSSLLFLAMASMFICFYIYDQKEEDIIHIVNTIKHVLPEGLKASH